MADEDDVQRVVAAHRERYGRLDVLVNNAGVGIGAAVAETTTKKVDMQLDVNLRAIILFYRECADLLRAAGAEHRNALVVNTASIAGKSRPGVARRSTPRRRPAVIGLDPGDERGARRRGDQVDGALPGVRRHADDRVRHASTVAPRTMIRPEDIAEAVRFLLSTSPNCVVPEIVFQRPGEAL